MDFGLMNKVALVTGAGSQVGFGKETAVLLAKEGCEAVAVTDIVQEDLDKTAAEVKRLGAKCLAVKADITEPVEVDAMVKAVIDEFGRIDILCNVAGGIIHDDEVPIDDQEMSVWERQMKLNLFGTMNVTKAVIPRMRETKGGSIVNIGSGSTSQYWMGVGVYAMSKHSMDLFTKQLATVEGPNGIRVNCVAPGPAPTNFLSLRQAKAAPGPEPTPEEREKARAAMMAKFPLGRIAVPSDIAKATLYFASDMSDYVTGQVLQVSGGNVM